MTYIYDDQNIFAKILRGEIPNKTVLETEHALAFEDIAPQAPVHVLVIPKGPYVNFDHFATQASDAEITDYTRAIAQVAHKTGAAQASGGNGYRILSNAGADGVQDVPHLHVHICAGRMLGRMLSQA